MSDFEREIEHELHRVLDPALPGTIPAWRVPRPWSMTKRILGGAGVALGVKVMTGVVLAAAAATVAGAAAETVVTGSVNPSVWGQQVKLQVAACKETLAAGKHGIGDCVSDFTSKHEEPATESNQAPEAADTKNPGTKKPTHPAPPAKNPGHPEPQPNAPKHGSAGSSQPPPQGRGFDREPTDPAITTSGVKPAPR
jgi:hypothetical protein